MNCNKIKELLLTDYVDNQANKKVRTIVQKHLAECRECRQFEKTIKETAVSPLRLAKRCSPPGHIWEGIKARLTERCTEEDVRVPIFERLSYVFRKPAFALSLAVMLLFIVVVIAKFPLLNNGKINAYIQEQAMFMQDLEGPNGDLNGLDTSIEAYFLS